MSKPFFRAANWKLFIALTLPLQIILVRLIASRPDIVEQFYAGNFYKTLSLYLRSTFNKTMVPVGQVVFYTLVLICVLWLVYQGVLLISRKIRPTVFFKRLFINAFFVLSIFHFLFMTTWGLNYHRLSIRDIAGIEHNIVSKEDLTNLSIKLIALTNESRSSLPEAGTEMILVPGKRSLLAEEAVAGFQKTALLYPQLEYRNFAVKNVYAPRLMSYFGTSGIYFPFTGEANINADQPGFLLPAVICHEMAHQIGFASEDEANFIAYLTCRLNPDPLFQYSGNLMALIYSLNTLKKMDFDAYLQLKETCSKEVAEDIEANNRYWSSFYNPLMILTSWFYDLFLKANDQPEGIDSYNLMVDLLIGEYHKNGLEYGD